MGTQAGRPMPSARGSLGQTLCPPKGGKEAQQSHLLGFLPSYLETHFLAFSVFNFLQIYIDSFHM